MKENVGKQDQLIRSLAGPALMGIGYFALGGNKGKLAGIASIVVGTIIAESAVTRVCPVNEFFGLDTRKKKKSPIKKIKEALV
ncbi:YgaP family membrane protein [Salinimicrobium sp. CAU 1759]